MTTNKLTRPVIAWVYYLRMYATVVLSVGWGWLIGWLAVSVLVQTGVIDFPLWTLTLPIVIPAILGVGSTINLARRLGVSTVSLLYSMHYASRGR